MKINISKIFVLLVIVFLINLVIKAIISTNQIKNLCKETKINNSIFVVKEYLKDSWLLRFSDLDFKGKNKLLVHSSSSFGRYNCSIEYKDEKVIKTEFFYLD